MKSGSIRAEHYIYSPPNQAVRALYSFIIYKNGNEPHILLPKHGGLCTPEEDRNNEKHTHKKAVGIQTGNKCSTNTNRQTNKTYQQHNHPAHTYEYENTAREHPRQAEKKKKKDSIPPKESECWGLEGR